MTATRIVVVVSGFPRRSETFLLNELLALEDAGALLAVVATKAGEPDVQPDACRLVGRVMYPPGDSPQQQAEIAAARLHDSGVSGVHGYFAHQPAAVALELARRLGVPFGFSVHAKDVRKISAETLSCLGRRARGVIACNPDAAETVRRAGHAVHLTPHGVDVERFSRQAPGAHGRLRLLAVGRLVEKKGFVVLIDAVARLATPFELRIIGEGAERTRIESRVTALGLHERVTLAGPSTHADLPAEYAWADLVVVPSIVDRDGDRDGLPNVILEAMASARAVIASDTSAVRMAVEPDVNGLLVPASDAAALAAAIERLARDRRLRHRLARAARLSVERDFALAACTRRFCDTLTSFYA